MNSLDWHLDWILFSVGSPVNLSFFSAQALRYTKALAAHQRISTAYSFDLLNERARMGVEDSYAYSPMRSFLYSTVYFTPSQSVNSSVKSRIYLPGQANLRTYRPSKK